MSEIIIIAAIALFAVPGILFYLFQHKLVFSPHYYPERSFFAEHSHDYQFQHLNVAPGIELEGMIYSPENPIATVLYFGGKEQDSVALIGRLSQRYPNVRIVTFNYRGYGHSGGVPREAAILSDAVVLYDWAVQRYDYVDLLGYSLGSSVAAYVASKRTTGKVVLVSAFDSAQALIKSKTAIVPKWLIRCRFETVEYVKDISAPVYLFTTLDDEVIPQSHIDNLRGHIRNLAGTKAFSGYNHAQLLFSDELKIELDKVFS
ncbi:MAG: alpha/beta hydrolase [Campylobacterota bacterium]|nr:alpha/beta hydrolase [Campylobacterota bacterium]